MLAGEVAVLKSCHGISVKCSRYRDTGPTDPSLIVDGQFKEDSTLCPVRALRYYLDRTKDLRESQSLLYISFKKGHSSDIRPATLSSWLKQTILLCYKQADQQALGLIPGSRYKFTSQDVTGKVIFY